MAAKVVVVGCQRGGVGKTTLSLHLATDLAQRGHRVLLIDIDGNCGMTHRLGIKPTWQGTYEVLLGQHRFIEVILRGDEVPLPKGVEFLAASRDLDMFESMFSRLRPGEDPELALQEPLQAMREHYDWIVVDTPPAGSVLTIQSYRSGDYFILSTIPTVLPPAMERVFRDLEHARAAGSSIQLLGVATTQAKRNATRTKEHLAYVEPKGGFQTVIHASSAVEQAEQRGITMFEHAPTHKVTDEFRALTDEVMQRIEELEGGLNG